MAEDSPPASQDGITATAGQTDGVQVAPFDVAPELLSGSAVGDSRRPT